MWGVAPRSRLQSGRSSDRGETGRRASAPCLLLGLAVTVLAACGTGREGAQGALDASVQSEPAGEAAVAPVSPAFPSQGAGAGTAAPNGGAAAESEARKMRDDLPPLPPDPDGDRFTPGEQRQVIKRGLLTVEVAEIDGAVEAVRQRVTLAGGYVVRSQVEHIPDARAPRRAWLTLRIPVERFDTELAAIRDLGEPRQEETSSEDVTGEFIDLRAQIANLEAQEAQLRTLMARAQEIGTLLEIQRELTRVRTEIDQRRGRLQFLENQVAFSTLELTLLADPLGSAGDRHDKGLGERIAETFLANLRRLGDWAEAGVVALVGSVPFLIPLGALGAAGWQLARRLPRRRGN